MEAWQLGLIVVGVIVLSASAFTLFMWRGVWLAQHRGQPAARSRWHLFVMGQRRYTRWRIKRMRAQGKLGESVKLNIPKSTHSQRAEIERGRHGKKL